MSTRTLLAFDASTPRTAIALGVIDTARGSAHQLAGFDLLDDANQSSTWLIDQIMTTLTSVGLTPRGLDLIACGVGPGTFTGTRVALAAAKGLALGLACPVLPVSTLAAIAACQCSGRDHIIATLDARRGELYAARFTDPTGRSLTRISDDRLTTAPQLLSELSQLTAPLVVGTGAAALAAALAERSAPTPTLLELDGVTAEGLWRATQRALDATTPRHPRELEATYLRGSYAELGVNRPKRPFVPTPFA